MAPWRRINREYTTKKLLHITCTGHKSLPPAIIKRNHTTYYIHWASKVATSANKDAAKNSIHNRQHFNIVQERLALPESCNSSSWENWWDCAWLMLISSNSSCIASIDVMYFYLIFNIYGSSSRSWAEARRSAWIWDWRSWTDSSGDFIELVSLLLASTFDNTSRHDFGIVSLSPRWVAFFPAIYVRGTSNGFVSLSLWQFFLASVISPWKRKKQTDNRLCMYKH